MDTVIVHFQDQHLDPIKISDGPIAITGLCPCCEVVRICTRKSEFYFPVTEVSYIEHHKGKPDEEVTPSPIPR